MNCPKCNTPLSQDESFCHYCGARINTDRTKPITITNQKSEKSINVIFQELYVVSIIELLASFITLFCEPIISFIVYNFFHNPDIEFYYSRPVGLLICSLYSLIYIITSTVFILTAYFIIKKRFRRLDKKRFVKSAVFVSIAVVALAWAAMLYTASSSLFQIVFFESLVYCISFSVLILFRKIRSAISI